MLRFESPESTQLQRAFTDHHAVPRTCDRWFDRSASIVRKADPSPSALAAKDLLTRLRAQCGRMLQTGLGELAVGLLWRQKAGTLPVSDNANAALRKVRRPEADLVRCCTLSGTQNRVFSPSALLQIRAVPLGIDVVCAWP